MTNLRRKQQPSNRMVLQGDQTHVESRELIGPAFRDMLRTIDKGGVGNDHTMSDRRNANKDRSDNFKYEWL